MTHNKQKDRTGGSFRIIPERRRDGVAGLSRTVPGGDAFASGAVNDCDVNNHEPDVEFLRTAHRLIERVASGAVDARQLKNPEQAVKIKDTAPRRVERNASGAVDAREHNNHEQKKKTSDTLLGRVERNASAPGAIDSGPLKNPEQEVKIKDTAPHLIEREVAVSGAVDAGQLKNPEPEVKTRDTPPRLVERATGLRGRSICSARVSKSTYRKRTERDLNFPDADVPYIKTEHAIRALVCSLMERQDRATEAIFLKLNDLEYRVDDLELCKPSRATKQSGTKKEAGD
ncbi:MAG: hypothetical protein STSR0009_31350 [Methanoregula sp.]